MTASPAPTVPHVRDPDWRAGAACVGSNPEAWFPTPEPRRPTRATEKAVRVCEGCAVTRDCLAYALAHATVGTYGSKGLGIYAGLTTAQRRELLRACSPAHA